MIEPYKRRIRSYQAAFALAKNVAAERPGVPLQRLVDDLEEAEKTYHYAQRWLHLYMPLEPSAGSHATGVQAKLLAAMELSMAVVSKLVEKGFDGVGYNGTTLKYIVYRPGTGYYEDPFRKKYGLSQSFTWSEDPWMMAHLVEKLAGGIRRVKAKTEAEVYAKLFIKEEIESGAGLQSPSADPR